MIKRALNCYIGCYRRHMPYVIAVIALTGVFTAVNVTTIVSDFANIGQPIDWRKPLLYEFSSAVAIMIMVPIVILSAEVWPPTLAGWVRHVPHYIGATLIFSAGHIILMVLMRIAAFPALFEGSYDFFHRGQGAISYEYWKDARTFVLLFAGFAMVDAALKASQASKRAAQALELKSGATRILVDPDEFLFARGAANYAEIVTMTRQELARVTLADLQALLVEKGVPVARIHRSYIINRDMIVKSEPLAGGDMALSLKGGHTVRASRRYRDNLIIG